MDHVEPYRTARGQMAGEGRVVSPPISVCAHYGHGTEKVAKSIAKHFQERVPGYRSVAVAKIASIHAAL